MKLSVIIPVYKVEPYLERCVQSVLRQTFKDMEIIMVDDGSPDNSGKLADQLATLDPRICVIHQENQGLSGARNTGLRAAHGEYVVFLDSDDGWLLDDGIETLFKDTNSDLIVFKAIDIYQNGHKVEMPNYDVDEISTMSNAQAVFSHLVRTQKFRMSACMLIARRDILIDNGVFFPLGYISEDVNWSLQLWQFASSVKVCNLCFYGYYHRESSRTTTPTIKVFNSYDKIFSFWKKQCVGLCINSEAIKMYLADLWTNMGYLYHQLHSVDRGFAIDILERHKDLLNNAISRKAKRSKALVHFFGVKKTCLLLGLYWRLRAIIK